MLSMSAHLIAFVIAFVATLLTLPVVSAAASRLGAIDVPGELSIHTRPTPRTGGLAIIVGFLIATAYVWWSRTLATESQAVLPGVLAGGVIIALAGFLDDVRRISPLSKLLGQFLAASVAIGLGVQTHFLPLAGIGLALTLFYLVGSANAVNWLDGMDGLAGGLTLIASICLGLVAIIQGNELVAVLAFALMGAVLGFLPFNFPRARVFMGDVGSLFLGFILASLGVLLADQPYNLLRFVAPLAVLGVLILNTVLALARRLLRREDLFSGDRDHTYDILARQWGSRWAVGITWAVSAFLGCVAVVAAWVEGWSGMTLVALATWMVLWLAKLSGVLAPLTLQEAQEREPSGWPSVVRAAIRALAYLSRRYMHPVLLDLATAVLSFYLALILRFSGQPGDAASMSRYAGQLTELIFFIAFIFAVSASFFGLYTRIWRYSTSQDTFAILGSGMVGTLAVLVMDLGWGAERPIPVSVVLMGGLLTTVGFVALRHRQQFIEEVLRRSDKADASSQRVLVVGAGEAGQHLARQMQNHDSRYRLVGFVDDDPEKTGLQVYGARVVGTISQIPDLVVQHQAGLVVVAMHQVSRERMNEIFEVCQKSSARIQILPDVMEQLDGTNGHATFRDLALEDLLGRTPREIDEAACRSLITGKVILVTGAAGSIGSELCQQVARYDPAQILALDQNETGLYDLGLEFGEREYPLTLVVGDVSDNRRMEVVWREYRPEVVFHCAAYKHVPMLEACPSEAVKTNVLGTLVAATFSQRFGTERFIFISSDKAACPVNVMGATKRVGELLVTALQNMNGEDTKFSVVRFGNVLGSRGSVVPTFAHQIARGGPVTVTHPQMKRFFMSIEEAVSLVIQAGAFTAGGDIFALDMGEQVYIDDLARKMIRLQGLRVDEDIHVEYVGVRPGEKLSENLFCPVCEVLESTRHRSITRVQNYNDLSWASLISNVGQMIELARQNSGDLDKLRTLLFGVARLACPQGCVGEPDALTQNVALSVDYGGSKRDDTAL
jgi:FlaA1/EpsC-like NDP-sugar epimerase/UDP-N-acetylmuramyl pentapeptide phosphotransferase/UDP-N-acetylglucosamine-1-phosphate transferase